MAFTSSSLDELKKKISDELSAVRFRHTRGGLDAAMALAEFFPELSKKEISAAALLHDVAKEMPKEEQERLAVEYIGVLDPADLASPQILHSLAAPARVKRDFPAFATPAVLSAVLKHTTGDESMSVFDKIIFVSDYIETGRTYFDSVKVREELFSELLQAKGREECERALNRACLAEINGTLASLAARGLAVHPWTERARKTLSSII